MPRKTPLKGVPIASAQFRRESAEAHGAVFDRINNTLPELVDALEDLAKGVVIETRSYDGEEVRVYRREPNLEALKYLVDRVMGRTVSRSESGDAGEFTGYEGLLQKMIAERKQVIVQEPRVLPPDSLPPPTFAGVDQDEKDALVRKLFKDS